MAGFFIFDVLDTITKALFYKIAGVQMILKINKIVVLPSTKIFIGIPAFAGLIDGIFYSFGKVEFEFDQQERNPSLFKSALF